MLRLSKLTDYGVVLLTCMARDPAHLFTAAELAGASGVMAPTVSKILKQLVRAGLLRSLRGAKGGYLLARTADAISLAEIIDALEGPVGMTECSASAGLCAQEGACSVRANWQVVNQVVRRSLTQVTLIEMAQPAVQPVFLDARRPANEPIKGDLKP